MGEGDEVESLILMKDLVLLDIDLDRHTPERQFAIQLMQFLK